MISTNKDFEGISSNSHPTTYYWSKGDTKPINNVINGACGIEMDPDTDTFAIYFFDKASNSWVGKYEGEDANKIVYSGHRDDNVEIKDFILESLYYGEVTYVTVKFKNESLPVKYIFTTDDIYYDSKGEYIDLFFGNGNSVSDVLSPISSVMRCFTFRFRPTVVKDISLPMDGILTFFESLEYNINSGAWYDSENSYGPVESWKFVIEK